MRHCVLHTTTKRGEKLILRGCFCGSLAGQDTGALMAAQKGVKAAWVNKRGKEDPGDEDGQPGHSLFLPR